jgi:hypothetical protein
MRWLLMNDEFILTIAALQSFARSLHRAGQKRRLQ